MQKEYSKISPTAVFCARMRAKQNVPYAKEVVNLIDTKYADLVEDLPDYENTLAAQSDFIPFIEGRYYSLNDVIGKIKNAFIVEIASGLSPRSLSFLSRKDVIYLETELDKLIKIKENILKDIINKENLISKNLFFMPVNPLEKQDIDQLGKFYLEKGHNRRLVIIHEGLLMYFNKKEKKTFRNNIKYLFENYAKNGLWLTPDFSRLNKKVSEKQKGKENIRNKISQVTERKFHYFESLDATRAFLNQACFKYKILSNENVVKRLIMNKSLQFNKRDILFSSENYRVWKIELS